MSRKRTSGQRDVVIIGGGHNGLVTAFYLAKAGYKPLVLERRAQPGGAAITEEFHPGFRCSTLAHSAGPLRRGHCPRHATGEARAEHDQDGRCGDRAVTRWPRPDSLPRHRKSRPGNRGVLAEGCDEVSRSSSPRSPRWAGSLAKRSPWLRRTSTIPAQAICGECSTPDAPCANWAGAICTACCAGDRWRWPIWSRNISRPNCCAPPSPRAEFSGHSWAPGPRAAAWCC